jgi:hypothetical protein
LVEYDDSIVAGGWFNLAGSYYPMYGVARLVDGRWRPLGEGLDGKVYALAEYQGDLYAAGDFGYFSPFLGNLARWDGLEWHPVDPGANDVINSLEVYGDDLIVGGRFTRAGGVGTPHIARWDGAVWSPLGSGIPGNVLAMSVHGDALVVGGDFSFLDGEGNSADNIVRWNGSEWMALGSMDGSVNALTIHDGALVAGGSFLSVDDEDAFHIARWNGSSWASVGGGTSDEVKTLASYEGNLIAGGAFALAERRIVNRIAIWDGESWGPMGEGFSDDVYALLIHAGELYAGGEFGPDSGDRLTYVGRWTGEMWEPPGTLTSGTHGLNGHVRALAEYGGALIAGGSFTQGGVVSLNRIGRWDGVSWHPMGSGLNGVPYVFHEYNDELIVGGSFTEAGGVPVENIARWNGTSWSPLGSGANDAVLALVEDEGELIVGGKFDVAGGLPAPGIARWDGSNWDALSAGVDGVANDLAVFRGDLYGVAGGNVLRFGGATWEVVGITTGYPGVEERPGRVSELFVHDDWLIASGAFQRIYINTCCVHGNNIGRYDGVGWHGLHAGMQGPIDDRFIHPLFLARVYALDVYGGELVAGGFFETAGSDQANSLARWNGQDWESLDTGIRGMVAALAVVDSSLYVGGSITSAGGVPSYNIARWYDSRVPVSLLSFTAERESRGVRLRWEVAGDPRDHAGFHVYRHAAGEERTQLTGQLLLGQERYEYLDRESPSTAIDYWLAEVNRAGSVQWHGPVSVDFASKSLRPILNQNRPNPFREMTTIGLVAAQDGFVRLTVLDVSGREVVRLLEGTIPAGERFVTWNGRDKSGRRVSPGVYFYRLETEKGALDRKLVVLP